MIRLIATDIDGTLLGHGGRVSQRTLAALTAARDAGALIVPASGRQPFSIAHVVEGSFLAESVVLGANGAVGYDLATDEVFFETALTVEAQWALVRGLLDDFPDLRCVSVRHAGATFVPQLGYVGMMDPGDHGRGGHLPEYPLEEVLDRPSLKLVVRDPEVPASVLLAVARSLDVPGCSVSTSGAPFLEVAAAGVDKGSGLARLVERWGVRADEVVAFGDNLNDVEMLAWAGLGVAMGNALPEVLSLADEVTADHLDDGVAVVVERLLAEGLI